MSAKLDLHEQVFEGKQLFINHYEIKEQRQINIEEEIDIADFEKYKAQEFGRGVNWSELHSQTNLVSVVTQLLQYVHHQEDRKRP